MVPKPHDKIFVLGSNSFSGACFCAHALKRDLQVFGISRSNEPSSVFLPYRWVENQNQFSFFPYDINHHQDEIISLLKAEKQIHRQFCCTKHG